MVTRFRWLNILLLASLLLGPWLSAAPTLAQGPEPPAEGALRMTLPDVAPPEVSPVEVATVAAPPLEMTLADPDAQQALLSCSAPATVPFGRDLELTLGPLNTSGNYVAQSAALALGWRAADPSTWITGTLTAVNCVGTSPGPEQVFFYEHANYEGNCKMLEVGRYPESGNIGIGNDRLSSVKVGANVDLLLCRDKNYGGICETLTGNDSNLGIGNDIGNDTVTSAKVTLAPHAYGIAAVQLGTDNMQVVMRTGNNRLVAQTWRGFTRSWGPLVDLNLVVGDSPAAVSRTPETYSVVARSGNALKVMHGDANGFSMVWQDVPGGYDPDIQQTIAVTDAVGSPALITTGPYQLTLFYRTSGGDIKYSEWQSGYGWRQTPVSLGRPTGTALSVDPVAVARDENNIAVFVVVDSKVYVKEWTTANASDWSDTTWRALTSTGSFSAKATPVAAVSRHRTHLGVSVLSTASEIWYLEWTASATTEGWSTPTKLDGILNTLGLVAASTEEMFLYGVNSSYNFYTRRWTRAGGWESWSAAESGWGSSAPAPVGVSPRPRELVLFGRSSNSRLQVKAYTSAQMHGATLTQPSQVLYGTPRSQAIATFDARTYWVSAYRSDTDGKWYLTARDTETWNGYTLQLSAHPNADAASNKVSVATADMNRDGDDEIVVATLKTDGAAAQVSVFQLAVNSAGTVTGLTAKATTTFALSGSTFTDINVAVGNLSNSGSTGVADEIAVAAFRNGYKQVRLGVYRFTGSSLSLVTSQTLDVAENRDLELTIAQIDGTPTEKIVFGVQGTMYAALYRYRLSGTTLVSDVDVVAVPAGELTAGPYTSAIASGDVDSDGLEEVVYSASHFTITYPDGVGFPSSHRGAPRALAVGDINMDGLAEVVLSINGNNTIYRYTHLGNSQSFIYLAQWGATGVPLLADIDGDSLVGSYRGCSEFKEVQVLTVANSQPQWHTDDRNNEGSVFNTNTAVQGDEYAWESSFGGSVTVGFEQEVSFIVKLGSVSSSVSLELMGSVGAGTTREESEATLSGGSYDGDAVNGVVCYTQVGYTCYAYDVTDPDTGVTSSAMACPTRSLGGQAKEVCEPLSDWYELTRPAAGDSWAPVGHRMLIAGEVVNTLDLSLEGNYAAPNPDGSGRTAPPVDPYLVWWDGWDLRKDVKGSTNPTGSGQGWEIQRESAVGTTEHYGFEANLTQSSGVNVGGFSVERSLTVGFGNEWNSSVSWSSGLGFNGEVYNYPNTCTFCHTYTIAPFVYRAQAVTLGGARYTYLEQDYYLTYAPWLTGGMNQLGRAPAAAEPETAVADTPPQAPVVTSPTHPDPDTWVAGDKVEFDWEQPAGDTGTVTGYRWDLNRFEVFTPTASPKMTTTHTYHDLADGAYYLHLRAEGNGAYRSPVVHRRVLVDNAAPQVAFVADPLLPNGYDGWYITPVAVSVVATETVGSGVASVEYSTDGAAWQPYTAPIPVAADTPGFTLWARATDNVGHTSEPVSTTIKLDTVAPSTYDEDGYGLSYASIITDEVGNAQLVLGGQLTDALAGRLQVEMQAGNTGLWHTVDAVGEFPMLPGNEFSTTISTLHWIYTPTFNVRGVYPLWGRGVDAAGNVEAPWIHGVFWWEPDDVPSLIESQVSVSPRQVYPGDVAAFTVGARNAGYQEAQLLITNTVPAGLTVVPGSISDGGRYDAATGIITWTLDALWPGQMRYLTFDASADATTVPITLENRLDLMGYWPWEPLPGVPEEPDRHYYTTSASVVVLPDTARTAAATSASELVAPRVLNAAVMEGDIVNNPQVTLLVNGTANAYALYVKEWVWDGALNEWTLAGASGWVPFQTAPGMAVSQDASGKYARYSWTLSAGDGVKYLGVWITDGAGQVSNLNEGNLLYTNLVSANGQFLAAGERVQYRVNLRFNDLALLNLLSLSGDADLYFWKPRAGFMPHYYSNAAPTGAGLAVDTVGFFAPEAGMYVIEVQAVTDAVYRLSTSGDLVAGAAITGAEAETTLPQSTHLPLAEKARPAHPLTLSTPYTLADASDLSESPVRPTYHTLYLPLVLRSENAGVGR